MIVILSINNNDEIKTFPVTPDKIKIDENQKNEQFETINAGTLNLIGDEELKVISFSSMFPNHAYPFLKPHSSSNGWEYVHFIKKIRAMKIPARLVICQENGAEVLNTACTVDSFSYSILRNKDIKYSITFKEYRFVRV